MPHVRPKGFVLSLWRDADVAVLIRRIFREFGVFAGYLFQAACLAVALVLGTVFILWFLENSSLSKRFEDDKETLVIYVPKGATINLNQLASSEIVCLFAPDQPVIGALSAYFPGHHMSRASEVRAEWVLARIESKVRKRIEIAYLKDVKSHGSNPGGNPCGRGLILDNSRFHGLDEQNVVGVEFVITPRGIRCGSKNGQVVTEEQLTKGACR